MIAKKCVICQKDGKYKCPKCLTFNCSLPCFTSHKDTCQPLPAQPEYFEDKKPARINVFTTIDTVPPEKLENLAKSESIKNLLGNPHLRNFLQEVNAAPSPWNAMKIAMTEPLFLEFADECMKIVEPPSDPQ